MGGQELFKHLYQAPHPLIFGEESFQKNPLGK
jgi:hypothetical protein